MTAIGSEKSYQGELKGADAAARSWSWTADPAGLVSISGASSREASIKGVGEGTAEVTVTAELADGTRLSDSMLLTSYTWLPRAYPATAASGGAKLTRAATGDDARDYVRCVAPAGQEMEVVGTCGEGYFRVRLPEGFGFADDDGHTENRNAFAPRDSVVVPAAELGLSETSREGTAGDAFVLEAAVGPEFATDRVVSWSSSDPAVAQVDSGGNVSLLKAGSCTVTAACGGASATCAVTVKAKPSSPRKTPAKETALAKKAVTTTRPYVKSRTAGELRLKWRAADGATSYDVQFKCGKKWKTAKRDVKGTSATVKKVHVWDPEAKKAVKRAVDKKYSGKFRVVPKKRKGAQGSSNTVGKAGASGNTGKVARYRLEATFIDVGHGDCILIKTPANVFILVDGGCTVRYTNELNEDISTFSETISAIKKRMGKKRTIALVVSTHPDYDHVGGLKEILKGSSSDFSNEGTGEFTVKELWYASDAGRDKDHADKYGDFSTLAGNRKGGSSLVDISTKRPSYSSGGVKVKPVHNAVDYVEGQGKLSASNLDSAMLLVKYKGFRMVLCADALGTAISDETTLLSVGKALGGKVKKSKGKDGKVKRRVEGAKRADVLQVSHHGMVGMSGKAAAKGQFLKLLKACRPRAMVLSTETRSAWEADGESHSYLSSVNKLFKWMLSYGKEKDALPDSETRAFRTDKDGDVTVTSYGKAGDYKISRAKSKAVVGGKKVKTGVTTVKRTEKKAKGKKKVTVKVVDQYKGTKFGKDNRDAG